VGRRNKRRADSFTKAAETFCQINSLAQKHSGSTSIKPAQPKGSFVCQLYFAGGESKQLMLY